MARAASCAKSAPTPLKSLPPHRESCPISVRRCTIGVNARLLHIRGLFNLRSSSDAPRNEFAGGERGDNRGTKCPAPKRCWTESNSAFSLHLRAAGSPDHPFRLRFAPACRLSSRADPLAPRAMPRVLSQLALGLRANPVCGVRAPSLHSAFPDRSVGKSGPSEAGPDLVLLENHGMNGVRRRVAIGRPLPLSSSGRWRSGMRGPTCGSA